MKKKPKLLDKLPFKELVVRRATWDADLKKWVEVKPKEEENEKR